MYDRRSLSYCSADLLAELYCCLRPIILEDWYRMYATKRKLRNLAWRVMSFIMRSFRYES